MTVEPNRETLTTADVAALLHRTPGTVRLMAGQGRIPAYRLDGSWLFDADELRGCLAARRNRHAPVQPARTDRPVPPLPAPGPGVVDFGKFERRVAPRAKGSR